MKNREEIVKEAARAAQACFQYYCDQKLNESQIRNIEVAIDNNIPLNVTTNRWDEYKKYYDKILNENNN